MRIYTTIVGEVTNTGAMRDVEVDANGNLTVSANVLDLVNRGITTANASNLTGTINNQNDLRLTGSLDKSITGSGTTKVNTTLTQGGKFVKLDFRE